MEPWLLILLSIFLTAIVSVVLVEYFKDEE